MELPDEMFCFTNADASDCSPASGEMFTLIRCERDDGWTTTGKLFKPQTNSSPIELPKFGWLARFFWPEILPATSSQPSPVEVDLVGEDGVDSTRDPAGIIVMALVEARCEKTLPTKESWPNESPSARACEPLTYQLDDKYANGGWRSS